MSILYFFILYLTTDKYLFNVISSRIHNRP